jgi:hypothetical protein
MPTIDIFNADAFGLVSLTGAVERVPYVPNYLGALGLFETVPSRTISVAVDRRTNQLRLVPTSRRGEPVTRREPDPRDIRDVRTHRIAKGDRISAHEVQGMRAFGTESELETVAGEVTRRMGRLMADMDLTWELHRLGAIQGVVLDADGTTVLNDWFGEFGISAPTSISFALGTAATDVRGKCAQVVRAVAKALGAPADVPVVGLCGDAFWDDLVRHEDVRDTFRYQEGAALRAGTAWMSLRFGGIEFHNYRGTDTASPVQIGTNDARFFPRVPGVFQAAFAPMESIEFANTLGRPVYAMTIPDRDRAFWVDVELYSYPLFICLRPEALQRGTRT